ncbi:MAG: hypothetical protein HY717_10015 [Planctomycetes bacterium]|nr:hypothetical protein [Planctomycetota bacterium]
MKRLPKSNRRDGGNTLILALMLIFFMMALSTAQFFIVQKNSRQSEFMALQDDVRYYAESGVHLALHDLRHDVTGNDGKIGTLGWTALNDVGSDGVAGTGDYGEGDGRPTPGEPNLAPVDIGPAAAGVSLIVYTEDSAWSSVKRIVSTAFSGEAEATVESYAQQSVDTLPRVGAIYVPATVDLDLNGNKFTISGIDINPDGTAGPGPNTWGIATEPGSPAGANQTAIQNQIAAKNYPQVTGLGTTPSVGENASTIDIDALFNAIKSKKDQQLASGTYTGVTWGTPSSYLVTYVNGDLHLSGTGTGAGVLLVDGNLTMSGQFTFQGLVIVRGDVSQVGGGSGVHVYGTILIEQTFTMVDPIDFDVSGSADLKYSSTVIANTETVLASKGSQYTVLYWNNIK